MGKSFQVEFSLQQKCIIIQESEESKTIFGNSRICNIYHPLYWKGFQEKKINAKERQGIQIAKEKVKFIFKLSADVEK